MALDVFVQPLGGDAPRNTAGRKVCRLEYNGDYLYLRRFLPASSSNGRRIEGAMGAGDAYFEGPMLAQLEGCLKRARAALDAQPVRWSEFVGTVMARGGSPQQRHDVVERERVRRGIDILLRATDEARQINGRLLFYGE